jgi:peptidyl-prolyl cis-trans isomerase A (cyclophilin A)
LVIPNDPVILSNTRGTISYAAVQDNAGQAVNRTTQVYINFADNSNLDSMGFTPFGVITETDMKVVDSIYAGYGQNPDQDQIYAAGDAYLKKNFPKLDYILNTVTVDE